MLFVLESVQKQRLVTQVILPSDQQEIPKPLGTVVTLLVWVTAAWEQEVLGAPTVF